MTFDPGGDGWAHGTLAKVRILFLKALVVGLVAGVTVGWCVGPSSVGAASVRSGHAIGTTVVDTRSKPVSTLPGSPDSSGAAVEATVDSETDFASSSVDPGSGSLNGVSCTSPTSCVAVGANGLITLAEVWNGMTWSVVPSPSPGSFSNSLNGVSCTSPTSCVAVGIESNGTAAYQTLVESWNGSTWSVISSPDPSAGYNSLNGVSCLSSTSCVAVGEEGPYQTLVESWNGSTWSVISSPDPSSSFNTLYGVSCTGPTSCVAVGNYHNPSSATQTLVESWNGSAWSVISSPDPSSSFSALAAVSCASSTSCVAVGTYLNTSAAVQTLVESWNGASWSTTASPDPGSTTNDLSGVSCTGPTSCVAVGNYGPASGSLDTLVESWNGNTWSVISSPNTVSPQNVLYAASCPLSTACAAVGYYSLGQGLSHTLAESWDGSTWKLDVLFPPVVAMAATPSGSGYWLVDSSGDVSTHGAAVDYGSMGGRALNAPIVGVAATPNGEGYWEVAADGGVFAFGNAAFLGSMGGRALNAPIVGMAPTADGGGYWLVAADGGVFAFGNAQFYGSMGGKPLNAPVVGMAPDATSGGYWLVAKDGGVFSFDAPFQGSMGGKPLNAPVVGMAPDATSGGYWLVASDGGVFTFGNAVFQGSMGGKPLNAPVVGMAPDLGTGGYWLVAEDGGVFSFDAPFYGAD